MQKIVLISLIFAVAHVAPQKPFLNSEFNDVWRSYKVKFGKKYGNENETSRRLNWESSLKYIQKHNLEYDLGKHTFTLGLNDFADMTNEEYRSTFLKTKLSQNNPKTVFMEQQNLEALPITVDWRTKGYVTPVLNQGKCGSCWAFSATGSLEGQYFNKTKNLTSFSKQQLVDCSGSYGNKGCDGGLMNYAFEYIEKFGIETEKSYPYTAEDGNCLYDKSKVVGSCTGYVDIPQGSETSLATATATIGPISVAIDASNYSFQLYKSGIYNEPECSSTQLDHGVLVVGYGTENGNNYWLVKNSWNTVWGISGYIKMSKDVGNQCGIATMASYPLV